MKSGTLAWTQTTARLPLVTAAQFQTFIYFHPTSGFFLLTWHDIAARWACMFPPDGKSRGGGDAVSQRGIETQSKRRVRGCFSEADDWLDSGERIKKKTLWMNGSLRREKERRVGKVKRCVRVQRRHTHTHVRTSTASGHHFVFLHHLSKLSPSVLSLLPSHRNTPISASVPYRIKSGDVLYFPIVNESNENNDNNELLSVTSILCVVMCDLIPVCWRAPLFKNISQLPQSHIHPNIHYTTKCGLTRCWN